MSDSDHLFISREEIKKLVTLLREIPELVEDLTVTLTRQDRLGKRGAMRGSGDDTQPLPVNIDASDVADDLHNTLSTWARHVCETRGVEYWPAMFTHRFGFIGPLRANERRMPVPLSDYRESIMGYARWLDRNVIALAMTEGAFEAFDEIRYAMRRARWSMDRPREAEVSLPPEERVEAARSSLLNSTEIERMRHHLGEEYLNLTCRRIKTLTSKTDLTPVTVIGDLAVYRLGDVLDAHLKYPTRQRSKVA